jgi:hypothetical protein
MNVPLTNSVLEASPSAQAGIASALINASREVAGLLGVTVIGAVLRARQTSALRGGASVRDAFIDGYHTGLWVTIALLAAGVVISYVTLRPRAQAAQPRLAREASGATAVPEVAPALLVPDAMAAKANRADGYPGD